MAGYTIQDPRFAPPTQEQLDALALQQAPPMAHAQPPMSGPPTADTSVPPVGGPPLTMADFDQRSAALAPAPPQPPQPMPTSAPAPIGPPAYPVARPAPPTGAGGGARPAAGASDPFASQNRWLRPGERAIRDAQREGMDTEQQGAEAAANNDVARQAEIARRMQDESAAADKFAADQQQQEAQVRNSIAARTSEIDEQSKALASQKVSAGKFWKNAGTEGSILAGIAMAIGAQSGAKGNGGVEAIDKAIDRDLRIQQANIDNSKAAIDTQRGVLADRMRQFGDLEQANLVARADSYNRARARIDAAAAKFGEGDAKAKLMQMSGLFAQKSAAAMGEWEKLAGSREVAAASIARADQLRNEQRRYDTLGKERLYQHEEDQERIKKGDGPQVRTMDGQVLHAFDENAAKKYREFADPATGAAANLEELSRLVKQYPHGTVASPEVAQHMRDLAGQARSNIKTMQGSGANLSPQEERMIGLLEDPSKLDLLGRTPAQVDDAIRSLRTRAESAESAYVKDARPTRMQQESALGIRPAGGR